MTRISFDAKEFQDFLEKQGCDCCMGWLHVIGGNIIYDWTSSINGVYKKHRDVELVGELIE